MLKMKYRLLVWVAIDEFKLNNDLKNPDEEQKYILGYLPVNEQWNYTLGVVYRHFHKKGF